MNIYKIRQPLQLTGLADAKRAYLTLREVRGPGRRMLGGDRGDLYFYGYTLNAEADTTTLDSPALHTHLELSEEEAFLVATAVLAEAFESVGFEAIEHS